MVFGEGEEVRERGGMFWEGEGWCLGRERR